jgi:hypothetical protein
VNEGGRLLGERDVLVTAAGEQGGAKFRGGDLDAVGVVVQRLDQRRGERAGDRRLRPRRAAVSGRRRFASLCRTGTSGDARGNNGGSK